MNSIHERHVPSQEKPINMNHTVLKITRWRNSIKTKIISRSCHHISLIIIFPTSQEFCNSDSVWESYANFNEDAHKFLCHKISHFSPRVEKFQRELMMNEWYVWYSDYIGCGEKLLPWANMQFKITNNKVLFCLVLSPKKVEYTNFKNSYLFKHKELEHHI